jgi:hypothetical protein
MADHLPASPPAAGEQPSPAPRPFDRSLLEATLADATRAVEAAEDPDGVEAATGTEATAVSDDTGDDGLRGGPPLPQPAPPLPPRQSPVGPLASGSAPAAPSPLRPPPANGTPAPPSVGLGRLVAPGAQALLSAATPAAPVEDRAVDAARLRVGTGASLRDAANPAGGGVTLPLVGTKPLAVAAPAGAPAPRSPAASNRGMSDTGLSDTGMSSAGLPGGSRPVSPPPAGSAQPPSEANGARRAAAPGSARARTAGETEPPAIRPWQPSDDDILPTGTARHRGRFRLR